MLSLNIPGFKTENLRLEHLVLDFNGTIAIDGKLIPGVKESLASISEILKIHVVTGNTFGTAQEELSDINCQLFLLEKNNQKEQKLKYIEQLGKNAVVSIGNGNNDQLLLKESEIGIIVLQEEGVGVSALTVANICCKRITDAFSLLLNPKRIVATLRS